MDDLGFLLIGFARVLSPENLAMLFIGLSIGMAVGIMPGLGIVNGIILALPFTYKMGIEPSIILLSSIYMAGTYAGAYTAILYRIPGESNDIPLLWDGYRMAQQGQAAKALGWALVAALTGGLVSTMVMVGLATPLSKLALSFGAPDYFAAVMFGLSTVVALGGKSIVNALLGLCIGLIISTVGVDGIYGTSRFTFDLPVLESGIPYLTALIGMYGVGEVLSRMRQPAAAAEGGNSNVKTAIPSWSEIWGLRATLARSTVLGTFLGAIPGAGATVTSFIAYGVEKQYGKRGAQLGSGLPEGIVAPQIGSTASVASHMVPLLTLGLPGSGATAIILAAFLLHGVQPGPLLFSTVASKTAAYTIFASMFAAVIGMCLMSFFWIRATVKMLSVPTPFLDSAIVMFCVLGVYADRNNMSDVWMVAIFGALGYLFEKYSFPVAPLVLGVILGPIAENAFMQSMISFDNDWTIFFRSAIGGPLMVMAILVLFYPLIKQMLGARRRGARTA
ncbi:MAG: tripartite tricarboxylate transporter permease [Hyphomicrobiaceae bacterium]